MPSNKLGMMAAAGVGGAPASGEWTQVGNTQGYLSSPGMAGLTTSTAAIIFAPYGLRTYSFNGTTWSQVGNQLNQVGTDNHEIVALTSTRIAWIDSGRDRLVAYDWDGTNWAQVGNLKTIAVASWSGLCGLARLSASRVAVVFGSGENKLATYDFDGTDWTLVGNVLTNISPSLSNTTACGLTSTRIVIVDSNDTMRAFDFDGTDWAQVGNTTTITPLSYAGLDRLSEDTVALYYATGFSAQSYIIKYWFNGTDFSVVDASYSGITAAYSNKLASLAVPGDDASRVVTAAGTATVRTFDFILD